MRLLDVGVVLDREKDIRGVDPKKNIDSEFEVLKELDDRSTSYAILSHRWGAEVNYDEMTGLAAMKARKRDDVRERDGYQKIIKSCRQAKKDGYRWLWIDTCCIDKRSSTELTEAINSMYRWYRNSQICYVHLNDVDGPTFPTKQDFGRYGRSNGWPEWFSRGWTLQELIAPKEIEFFNKSWVSIGTKQGFTSELEVITRIPGKVLSDAKVLRGTNSWEHPGVAQIMSWAADRMTTRLEDRAYSLLGLFGVSMPMLYGEGSRAFQRLQLEIIRVSSDHSIFAWNPKGQFGVHEGVLADDPRCFRDCHDIKKVHRHEFYDELATYMRPNGLDMDPARNKLLSSYNSVDPSQLSRWDVSNLGIHVLLPVLPDRDHPTKRFKAILPYCDRSGYLITIDLQFCQHGNFSRYFEALCIPDTACPEFRSLCLNVHSQDTEESYCHHHLRLDDKRTSRHGFTRRGAFPREIAGDIVTFSPEGNAFIVLVYTNNDAGSRFAVGLGYYLGKVWAHVVCDECPASQKVWSSWADFANRAYDTLWNSPIDQWSYFGGTGAAIKDTHLPRSIWNARVVVGSTTDAMIAVEPCPGFCTGPRESACASLLDDLWRAWMSDEHRLHQLDLGGRSAWLETCFGQEIALGDYGNTSGSNFKRRGNILEDMQELGISPTNSIYRPVVSLVSSCKHLLRHTQHQKDVVMTSSPSNLNLLLHHPRGLSLPNNEEFELLLKVLSTRLAGNRLVTTVIKCSRFHRAGEGGQRDLNDNSGTFTPLCVTATLLAWHKEPACEWIRERFKKIR